MSNEQKAKPRLYDETSSVKCGVKLNTDMPYQEQIIKSHNPSKQFRHRVLMKQWLLKVNLVRGSTVMRNCCSSAVLEERARKEDIVTVFWILIAYLILQV